MSQSTEKKYRVFGAVGDLTDLPSTLQVEEEYPAFVVVSGPEEAIQEVMKRRPVELLKAPMLPPKLPELAGLAGSADQEAASEEGILVVQFDRPVKPEWIEKLQDGIIHLTKVPLFSNLYIRKGTDNERLKPNIRTSH